MTRQKIPKEQLIQLINSEIGKCPTIKGCKVSGVYSLREVDENGCNWSLGFFNSSGIPPEISRPLVQSVIENLQINYNLEQTTDIISNAKNASNVFSNTLPTKRLLHICFSVDTNCVNARQRMAAMNQLEQWAEDELIQLFTAETAQSEMVVGNNIDRQKKAYNFIYTISEITTSEELDKLQLIEKVIFPEGAKTQNQKNDVEIVFNAGKYNHPLITKDGASKSQPGGILGNKKKLSALGIRVITPDEAVTQVRQAIQQRDDYARQWASVHREALPSWVGRA